jgi:hypothetical protein
MELEIGRFLSSCGLVSDKIEGEMVDGCVIHVSIMTLG